MNCKSNLKLIVNIVDKEKGNRIGLYIPFDLKPKEQKNKLIEHILAPEQRAQRDKELFYVEEENILDVDDRYSNDNKECEGCPYIDICV